MQVLSREFLLYHSVTDLVHIVIVIYVKKPTSTSHWLPSLVL